MISTALPEADESRAMGDRGMRSAATNAARGGFSSTEVAGLFVAYLEAHGPTPGEDLVMVARKAGHIPHDDRAFGAVFAGLSRKKRIKCVDFVPRRRGHGTAGGRVWALVR